MCQVYKEFVHFHKVKEWQHTLILSDAVKMQKYFMNHWLSESMYYVNTKPNHDNDGSARGLKNYKFK